MRIYLVRHGQSLANVDKTVHKTYADHAIPLSDEGHDQAAQVGEFFDRYFEEKYVPDGLVDRGFEGWKPNPRIRLWASPYVRASETADHIGAHTPFWLYDRREHILLGEQQFGLFDGIPDDELPNLYPVEHAHYEQQVKFEGKFWAPMPLGESRFDVAKRVHQSFGTFHRDADKHDIKDIIVVSHGVTIRAFLMMWLHLPVKWFEDEPNPQNCSVRLIEDGEDKGYIFPGFKSPRHSI